MAIHGFIPPARFFPYLTWTEIEAMPDRDRVVMLQPLGAIEQHGPHLPLVVDAAVSAGVLGKALERLPAEIPAYSLPPLYYGKSNEHRGFPGTICLSATTLMALLMEVGESIYQAGFRKFALVNAHGGQPQVLEIVARDLRDRHPDFMVFPLFVWRAPHIARELVAEREWELGIHAGDGETSLMLALLPETVRLDRAVTEYPADLPQNSLLSMEGANPFAWLTRDLSRSGTIGDAKAATREKGDRLLESMANGWVQLIADLYRFEQPHAQG